MEAATLTNNSPAHLLAAASKSLGEVERLLLRPNPRRLDAVGDHLSLAGQLMTSAQQSMKSLGPVEQEACRRSADEAKFRLRRIRQLFDQLGRFSAEWGSLVCSELGYSSAGTVVEMSRSWQSSVARKVNFEG